MKKYIVRAVCLAAVFLLAFVPASASVRLSLKEYGLHFDVPDGLTWIYTEDAGILSDDAKNKLEIDSAIGGLFAQNLNYCSVTLIQDDFFGAIDYAKLSDEKLIGMFADPIKKNSGYDNMRTSVYYDRNGKRWLYVYLDSVSTLISPFNAHVTYFDDTAVCFLSYGIPASTIEASLNTLSYDTSEIKTNAYFPNAVVTSDSSYFSRIGYDVKGKILYVTMREDGKDYEYKGVSAATWGLLKVGGAVDKYFDIYVRLQHEAMPLQ